MRVGHSNDGVLSCVGLRRVGCFENAVDTTRVSHGLTVLQAPGLGPSAPPLGVLSARANALPSSDPPQACTGLPVSAAQSAAAFTLSRTLSSKQLVLGPANSGPRVPPLSMPIPEKSTLLFAREATDLSMISSAPAASHRTMDVLKQLERVACDLRESVAAGNAASAASAATPASSEPSAAQVHRALCEELSPRLRQLREHLEAERPVTVFEAFAAQQEEFLRRSSDVQAHLEGLVRELAGEVATLRGSSLACSEEPESPTKELCETEEAKVAEEKDCNGDDGTTRGIALAAGRVCGTSSVKAPQVACKCGSTIESGEQLCRQCGRSRPAAEEKLSTKSIHHKKFWIQTAKKEGQDLLAMLPAFMWKTNTRLVTVLEHHFFADLVGLIIIANAILIGVETNIEATSNNEGPPVIFEKISTVMGLVFVGELSLRILAFRLHFIMGAEKWWNLCDTIIVLCSVFEMMANLVQSVNPPNMTMLRVIRALRFTRVIRVIRLSSFFRELRTMVLSIICSVKPLIWVIVLLSLLIYIFAVILTKGVAVYLHDSADLIAPDDNTKKHQAWTEGVSYAEALEDHYGSVFRSAYTLFKSAFGGGDWSEYFDVVVTAGRIYGALFLVYMTFMLLAVLNIVTGIFVETALSVAHADVDVVIQEEMDCEEGALNGLRFLLQDIDPERKGQITLEQIQDAVSQDPRVQAHFRGLGIVFSEAVSFFDLLDTDDTGKVDAEEFLLGCMKLRGTARSIDIQTLLAENKKLCRLMRRLVRDVEQRLEQKATDTVHAAIADTTKPRQSVKPNSDKPYGRPSLTSDGADADAP